MEYTHAVIIVALLKYNDGFISRIIRWIICDNNIQYKNGLKSPLRGTLCAIFITHILEYLSHVTGVTFNIIFLADYIIALV